MNVKEELQRQKTQEKNLRKKEQKKKNFSNKKYRAEKLPLFCLIFLILANILANKLVNQAHVQKVNFDLKKHKKMVEVAGVEPLILR